MLGSGGAGHAILEESDQLRGMGGWREAGLAGAGDGKRFVGGEMGESFFEGSGEIELGRFRGDAEDGFAETEDAVGGGFEGLRGGVVRMAGDDNLQRMRGENRGGEGVGGGEEAVLRGDAGESFERFLGEGGVAIVAGGGVHSNEGDAGDGIRRGRGYGCQRRERHRDKRKRTLHSRRRTSFYQ